MAKKKRRKKRQPETPMERLKAQPLWLWGTIFLVARVFANLTNEFMIEASNLHGAAADGARFGGAAASFFFVVVGLVLILIHFIRRA